MRSTESAPGAPVIASGVAFAGRVKTSSRPADRVLRVRRVGEAIWAATDSSRSASSGTVSSTGWAGIVVQAPPGQTRTAVTESSSTPAPADTGTPLSPSVTAVAGFAGSANSSLVACVQVRERVDVGAALRVHLEVEVVDALGVTGIAVVGDLPAGFDASHRP